MAWLRLDSVLASALGLVIFWFGMLEDEVIWGILVCMLKLDRILSRSEQVKL